VGLFLIASLVIPTASEAFTPSYTGVSSRTHSLTQVTDTEAEHAEHPALRLVSVMAPWSVLEPSDQSFDWAQMDANVAAARAGGYRLIFRIMAGRAAPTWFPAAGVQELTLLAADPNAPDYCDRVDVPVPWDPNLAQQYTQLMRELALWLDQPDGSGGRKGDHIYLIPVSMPSYQGTEMVVGYGASTTCPAGTTGAGQNLRTTNLAAWNSISTETERRSRTEQAWREAIAIHMAELPLQNDSVIAYGAVFNDGQAASLRIAAEEVARYPGRLWSMYTNLQPLVRGDGSYGRWREWCPACHEAIMTAIQAGGTVGFLTAGGSILQPSAKYRAAVEDALASYPIAFLETAPDHVDDQAGYLLGDSNSVQDRIALQVDDRITSTFVSCEAATIGVGSTCAATVTEFAGEPPGEPGGTVSWSSTGAGSFSPQSCTPVGGNGVSTCSVTYTPSPGSAGSHTVTGTYAADATHFGSSGSGSLSVAKRASATSATCSASSLVTGAATTCTAVVSDAGASGSVTPGGSVGWTTSGTGSFTPGSCSLSGSGPATCSVSFVPTSTGTHRITASYAGDASHLASDSGGTTMIDVTPDQPPTVAITSPANNATVSKGKTVVIAATAADDVGVVSVVFSVDGKVTCTDTTAPYSCSWAVPRKANVKYTLLAVAKDTANHTASHSIVVTAR
jgi:hypothetical protein